jgi:hypothetical protein
MSAPAAPEIGRARREEPLRKLPSWSEVDLLELADHSTASNPLNERRGTCSADLP